MIDLFFIIEKLILISIVLGITLIIAAYSTLAERKLAAFFQDRIGPDRAGPFGILQPLCDGVKFLFKEAIIPMRSDRFLFLLGPSLSMLAACMACAVIPWGNDLVLFGRTVALQITDLNVGVLYLFGLVSFGVYGVMIGGWASNNKYSLLSTIRASSQMISYEIAMGLSLIALVTTTGTLSLREIVLAQSGFQWNILIQPLGFIIFIICAFAETNRVPFDLPECETELVGGYHTEYSGMQLGFYLFAEYINMFISSTVMVCLYFGGFQMPFIGSLGLSSNVLALLGVAFFFVKIFAFMFLFIWIRWTLPRFRYDQLMRLGWTGLIPLAIINLMITAVIQLCN
jgi:NADH-quinone oxidoreductase subunit H